MNNFTNTLLPIPFLKQNQLLLSMKRNIKSTPRIKIKLFSLLIGSLALLFWFPQQSNAQCTGPTNNFQGNISGGLQCGSENTASIDAGNGYVALDVVNNAQYSFRTCNTVGYNTRVIADDNTNFNSPYFNQDSDNCSGGDGEEKTWTASFTGTLYLTVRRNDCQYPGSQSAVLKYKQDDNLTFNPPSQVCVSSSPIDLSAGTISNPSGGSFSGPGVSGTTFDPSAAGVGSQTVTFTLGECSKNATINVTDTPSVTISKQDVSCNGASDGEATANPSGNGPFDYAWNTNPQQNNQTATGLSQGTYTVTVTDNNGCSGTASVTINEPPPLVVTIDSSQDASCNGVNDGKIYASATGGTGSYSFSLNGSPFQPNGTFENLSAGNYEVVAQDDNNCRDTASVTLSNSNNISLTVDSKSDVSCNGGDDGSVTFNATGGTSPYEYSLDNITFQSSPTFNNLSADSYSAIVRDAQGCTETTQFTISEPPELEVTVDNVVDNGCAGNCNGEINISVNGGTSPYAYNWSNGSTSQDITGLCAGQYSVTVTDGNGCTTTASATVDEASPLNIDVVSKQNVSCNANADGEIDITVTGGTPSYNYNWSNSSTTEDVTGLSPGTYSVTVTDQSNCSEDTSVTITQPPSLTTTVKDTNVSCNGASDGSVDLTVTGGTSPFTYLWSDSSTTQDLSNLSPGNYTVTITDSTGCVVHASANISEPASLTISLASKSDVSCNGDQTGQIDITVQGGNPSYNIAWSSGDTTEDLSGVGAGNYDVTVTDQRNCSATASYAITEPPALTSSIDSVQDVTCFGDKDGYVDLSVSGGTPPYTYFWSNFSFSQDLNNVAGGKYVVTITDSLGCTTRDSVTISEPSEIVLGFQVTQSACGQPNGSVNVIANGGVTPYMYQWSNGDTTQQIDSLTAGTYTVTVTDSNGCTAIDSAVVETTPPVFVDIASFTNVSCKGGQDGAIDITPSGGTVPYSYNWSNGDSTEDISGLAADTFAVTVTDGVSCSADTSIVLTEPDSLSTSITGKDVSCFNASDGSVDLNVSGGTPPYDYLWSNFANTQDLDSIGGGEYTVVVTDSLGCTIRDSIVIDEPDEIQIMAQVTNAGCGNTPTGAIDISVKGGTSPYSYSWSNGDSTQDINNVAAGTYTVTVTDAKGCTATLTETVDSKGPQPTALFQRTSGCEGSPVQFVNQSSVSSGELFYFWNFKDSSSSTLENPTHTFDEPGTYSVSLKVLTDEGCVDSISQTVTISPLPSASIEVEDSTSICPQDSATLRVEGQVNTTYQWSTGAADTSITVNQEGTYSVTVTDTVGCTNSDSVAIEVFDPPVTNAGPDTTVSKGFDVQLFASGGTSYLWQPDQWLSDTSSQAPMAQPLDDIQYTVTITDQNGCQDVETVDIQVVDDFSLVIPNLITPNDDGYNDTWQIENIIFYEGCQVRIFDRWGTEVFSSSDYQNDWDGTSNDGGELSEGTYYYVIDCENGEKIYKGSVSILK